MNTAAGPTKKYAIRYHVGVVSVVDAVITVTASSIIAPSTMGALGRNRAAKYPMSTTIGKVMINWEAQRASGNPKPWWSVLGALWVFLPGCLGFAARKKSMERRLARRRALESMRAALDEDTIVLPRK
jgi:hypothetical protein